MAITSTKKTETIVLGTGCFWCTEAIFEMFPGVVKLTVGYAGGTVKNPSYEAVSSHTTGHIEVAKIEFDPKVMPIEKLLEIFFAAHDPTSLDRQGADVGEQYRSVIFYSNDEQKKAAEAAKKKAQPEYDKPIVTEVRKLTEFYTAEDYHQHYYDDNEHAPYCMFVIRPKIAKIKKEFGLK